MRYKIIHFMPIPALLVLLMISPAIYAGELAGHKFLITSVRTGETEIFLMDPDTRDATNLTRSPNSEERYPCFSPDGKTIAFTETDGKGWCVFLCDADGTNVRQLTHLGMITCPAAWSPNGKWISMRVTDNAFWRDKELMEKTYREKRGDKRPVWVVRPDGSNPHVVEALRYQCAIDGSRPAWKPK